MDFVYVVGTLAEKESWYDKGSQQEIGKIKQVLKWCSTYSELILLHLV